MQTQTFLDNVSLASDPGIAMATIVTVIIALHQAVIIFLWNCTEAKPNKLVHVTNRRIISGDDVGRRRVKADITLEYKEYKE